MSSNLNTTDLLNAVQSSVSNVLEFERPIDSVDGIAFDENGSRDMTVVEADGREDVFIAEIDLDRLRHYRAHEAWGNAYRKPSRYALLTAPEVQAPFIRSDARR